MGSTPETILGGGVPWTTGYTPTLAQWDALFAYKQDGNLQSVLPSQTVTGASKVFATADLQMKTRRSNSGSAMTDTFPASSATGMVNGARITIANTDATASITITAGSGTAMPSGSTDVIPPGRDVAYEYDLANTIWRGAYNTRSVVLGPSGPGLTLASGWSTPLAAALGSGWSTAFGSALGASVATGLTTSLNSAGGFLGYSALGTGVYSALGNAPNAANGLVQLGGTAIGTGVQAALSATTNTGSGLLTLTSGKVAQANLTARASSVTSPSSPTAPASTSAYKMQGLAAAITPATSGTVLITISGTVVAPSGTTVDNGILYQISYGTGAAPSNAAALTGTQVGPVQEYTSAIAPTAAADIHVPFSISYLVTGLTVVPATTYWVDLAAQSVTTVSAMGLANVAVVITEQ